RARERPHRGGGARGRGGRAADRDRDQRRRRALCRRDGGRSARRRRAGRGGHRPRGRARAPRSMESAARMTDHLEAILARKRIELARRASHRRLFDPASIATPDRRPAAIAALTRGDGAPRVIAEIKFRSPSEGAIRAWRAGEGARVARAYEAAGAAAISVLADRTGFGGGVLEVRRVAAAVARPVLFKE